MNIQVKRRPERFAIISTAILENESLSWRAKGIFSYLISRPDGWTIRVQDLINRSTEGRDAVKSALKELRAAGYASLLQSRNDKGHIIGTTYQIYEQPINVQPADWKTVGRANRRTGKPSDGKPVDIVSTILTNTNPNNKEIKKGSERALFQSDTSPELFLKKYFSEDSLTLRAPGQPAKKTVDRWLQMYGETYLVEQLQKFEAYLQKPKNKKKSAKKIKSASSTINNWLKKEWIDCPIQRQTLEVFRQWWSTVIEAPFQFDSYQTSDDRRQLESFVDGMTKAGKDPVGQLRDALAKMPDFWKGKRLSSILKNFADISKPTGLRAKVGAGKQSATIQDLDWLEKI